MRRFNRFRENHNNLRIFQWHSFHLPIPALFFRSRCQNGQSAIKNTTYSIHAVRITKSLADKRHFDFPSPSSRVIFSCAASHRTQLFGNREITAPHTLPRIYSGNVNLRRRVVMGTPEGIHKMNGKEGRKVSPAHSMWGLLGIRVHFVTLCGK